MTLCRAVDWPFARINWRVAVIPWLPASVRIVLTTQLRDGHCDRREGLDRPAAVVRERFDGDLLFGHLVALFSYCADRIKVLPP